MSIAQPQELVGHAVAGKEIPKSDVVDLKTALLREVRKKTKKGFYQESLDDLQAEAPLETGKLRQVVNNIGTRVDPDTGELKPDATIEASSGTSEQNLVNDLKNEVALIQKLADEGYRSLDSGEQQKVRESIERRIKSNAAIAKDFAEQSDPKAFIENLINSPAFIPKFKDIVNENAREGDLDTSFLQAYQKYMEKKADFDAAEKKVEVINTRAERVRRELARFDGTPNAEGDKFQRLRDLEDKALTSTERIPDLQRAIDRDRGELDRLISIRDRGIQIPGTDAALRRDEELWNVKKRALDDLETQKTTLEAASKPVPNDLLVKISRAAEDELKARRTYDDTAMRQPAGTESAERNIIALRDALSAKERELAELRSAQDGALALRTEYNRLKNEEEDALKDLATSMGEKGKIDSQMQALYQEYQRAVNLRKGQQVAFAEKLKSCYGEAAHRVLVDEMIFANNQAKTLHDDYEKKSFTEAEKGLNNYLAGARWHQGQRTEYRGLPGFRRKVTYNPIRRSEINKDWKTLMTDGSEKLVKDMLLGVDNPFSNPPKKYTLEDLDDLFDDEEAMKRMQDMAVKQLILKRMQNGGMTAEDIDILTQRELGTGIVEAIKQRDAVRQAVEDMDSEGVLERHGFKARFAQVARQNPWMIFNIFRFPEAIAKARYMRPVDETLHSQT